MLYSYKGRYPKELPNRIRLSNGTTRTDKSTFTEEEILYAGYIQVEDKPQVDESLYYIQWKSDTLSWVVIDRYTEDQLKQMRIKNIEDSVQYLLDNEAKNKGYDNIISACTYASFTNPFQEEGQKFVEWRGNVWATCYQILTEVDSGTRSEPTWEELLVELPISPFYVEETDI